VTAGVPPIRIERTTESRVRQVQGAKEIAFSSAFSDHMMVAAFRNGQWQEATIREYGPLALPPNVSSLQYGLSVFEGLKAHRTPSGKVALFRPGDNARRLSRSAVRMTLPEVPERLFLEGLRELVRLDKAWVPSHELGALYIRPCLFSVDASVRVKPPEECLFVIFTFPFTSYYTGALDLIVEHRYARAFPGGTGDIKPAGNYAPALLAEREAREAGFSSVLWLDGATHSIVEECGVMNVFFVIDDTVITPALTGTILPGITRDSAIRLMREAGIEVVERAISVDEIFAAHESGALKECFGTGTAATLSHVQRIRIRDRDIRFPPITERCVGTRIRDQLMRIATGQSTDTYGWLDYV
jgi:branched-chain amino acid aminotransferase